MAVQLSLSLFKKLLPVYDAATGFIVNLVNLL